MEELRIKPNFRFRPSLELELVSALPVFETDSLSPSFRFSFLPPTAAQMGESMFSIDAFTS